MQPPESTANMQDLQAAMQSGVITDDLPFSRGQIRDPTTKSTATLGARKPRRVQPSEKMKQLEDFDRTIEDHKALSILKTSAMPARDSVSYDSESEGAVDDQSPEQ